MKKGVKKITVKYVTNDTFLKAMAKHAEIMAVMLKEITAIHEDTEHSKI